MADRRRRRTAGRYHVAAIRPIRMGPLRLHGLCLFAGSSVCSVSPRAPHHSFPLRADASRHSRECRADAGRWRADPAPPPRDLYHLGGCRRRCGGRAGSDDAIRCAGDAELSALRGGIGDPGAGRSRPALRRDNRRRHFPDRTGSVFRHQSAVLVFLDRPPSGRRGHLAAEWNSRRARTAPGAATTEILVNAVPASGAALRARGLSKNFGSLAVARNINLELPQGARYALIGPNGAGKTTLINLLTGTLQPAAGQIFIYDQEITALKPDARVKRGLVRTFQ